MRVFRAGRNFYNLRLFRWGFGQIGALAGILISVIFIEQLQRSIEEVRVEVRQPVAPAPSASGASVGDVDPPTPQPVAPRPKVRGKSRQEQSRVVVRRVAERWPWWLFPLLTFVEGVGVLLYLIQLPITYAMVRLDYELRWYIVTDRSLRIRAGLASVLETTMSFANVQHVVVTQGPLQRVLGIADVRVQSAGGGGDRREGAGDSLHTGVFHGVNNASQIRDLIQDRLRAFRQAGLGDPDDAEHRHGPATSTPDLPQSAPAPSLVAAHELLAEARALRKVLQ